MCGWSVEECPPPVTDELLEKLKGKTGGEDSVASIQASTQREVSLAIDLKNFQNWSDIIKDLGSVRDKARMYSLGLPNLMSSHHQPWVFTYSHQSSSLQ